MLHSIINQTKMKRCIYVFWTQNEKMLHSNMNKTKQKLCKWICNCRPQSVSGTL